MLKLLKTFKKKEWLLAIISFLLIFFQVWLELKMPDYMSKITQLVQTDGSSMKAILENGGYMLACAFGSLIAAIIVGYLISIISATFSKRTRKMIFTKVEELAIHEVKQFSTNSLITRTTNDVTQIEMLIAMGLQLLIKAPITAIWAVTKILNKSVEWSIITAIAVVILLSVIASLVIIVMPRFKMVQKLTDSINGVTRENLTGIRVVRAFNAEKYQEDKFKDVNNKLTNLQLFNQKKFAIMSPIMYLVMYFLTLSIYFVGAKLIDNALMADKIALFGDMVVFSSYAMQIIMSFLMLAMIFMMLPRAQVSAKRINEVLDTDITIKDGELDKDTTDLRGYVEFKNVSFKYPDAEEYLLENISFKAKKGETVAFIGSTGSGKSSLINLIPRFYDATSGEVLVDGVNVKDYKQEFLHQKIGYIPQKAVMFNGTVKSNITYGDSSKEKTEKTVKDAIRVAQAEEFVSKLENKENHMIAERGNNLSGGQKQRMCIARALVRNSEIVIFDDSFSALDYKTDKNLRNDLKTKLKGTTVVIVAQRIGTIKNADKIVVLDHGKIVGMGKHEDLLKNCKVYYEIATSQLDENELKGGK